MAGRGGRRHAHPALARDGGGRVGGWLVLIGACAVLSGTFFSGFLVGRQWPRVQVMVGLAKPDVEHQSATASPPTSSRDSGRAAASRPRNDDDAPVDVPKLTFYEELTAPLSSPPHRAAASDRGTHAARKPPRFTAQVAAYATRAQADALRARLGTKGIASDVSEVVTPAGTRWRVRLGTYASREEAHAAAGRLARETTLEAVVMRADGAADAAR